MPQKHVSKAPRAHQEATKPETVKVSPVTVTEEALGAIVALDWQRSPVWGQYIAKPLALKGLVNQGLSPEVAQAVIAWHQAAGRLRSETCPGSRTLLIAMPSLLEWAKGATGDGPWSQPDGPSQWAKVFRCSVDTLKRRIKAGKLRVKKDSTKSWRIHKSDLPQ